MLGSFFRAFDICQTTLGDHHGSPCERRTGPSPKRKFKKKKLEIDWLSFPPGDAHKTRETKAQLENELLEKQCGRDTGLIALGGGVVLDLVGFLGATYCRGIPVIYVPTTLLAMVDAAIGGKTGVNTPWGKNLIGAFSQPDSVWIDISVLSTLSDAEYANGLVEVFKHALIDSAALWDDLIRQKHLIQSRDREFLSKLIYQNILIKKKVIEVDEHESGIREILNFGHSIGHAIEKIEEYRISHGEAVAIGLIVESHLSVLCGFLKKSVVDEIEQLLRLYGLPLKTRAFEDLPRFRKALKSDKKSIDQKPRFVLLDAIGRVHQEQSGFAMSVNLGMLDEALDWAREKFKKSC